MIIQTIQRSKKVFAVLAFLACLGSFTIASAQLDPGEFTIRQNGVTVGIAFVADRPPDATLYAEHWILFSNYQYPNAHNRVVTELVPDLTRTYTSETDFFRRAPWGPGFRYVHVTSNDTTFLPGR